jgi:RNA polymerase sigma factor (sigma-70 family)
MVTIVYEGQRVLVTQEVAAFLEQDDRRMRTQARSDRRHLAYCRVDPDKAVVTHRRKGVNLVLNQVIRNLQTEELRKAVRSLPSEDQLLIKYRYCDGMTMQEIGDIFGISKMAVSKRHKKLLGKLRAMLSASSFLVVLVTLWVFQISEKAFFDVWFTDSF